MTQRRLTDRHVRTAKLRRTPYRIADSDGLYLYVPPSGVRSWQFRYNLHGKQQTATLARLSEVGLAEARVRAHDARKQVADGIQLTVAKRVGVTKRRIDAENNFKAVADDWVKSEALRAQWTPRYQQEVESSIRNHLSDLNTLPLTEVTAAIAAPILRKVEKSALYMLEKIRRRLRAILDYGVEQGVIAGNPLPSTRWGPKIERCHYPAVTDLTGIGTILWAHDASEASKGVRRGHQLIVFTALRVNEAVPARWSEFNFETATWTVPRERMKIRNPKREDFEVPLPAVLAQMLLDWKRSDGNLSPFVCLAPRDPAKHITAEAIEKHYRNVLGLGGKHSPYSWRSAFSTIARDAGKDENIIEKQLGHVVGEGAAKPYNGATLLALRRELMTWYTDTLISARDKVNSGSK